MCPAADRFCFSAADKPPRYYVLSAVDALGYNTPVLAHLPPALTFAYFFIVGAALGSFVGVIVARLPQGQSIVRPRSYCPACSKTLAWYENVPLLSYLALRGRCRRCRAPIPVRYFTVELLMAALAVALWTRFGASWQLLLWLPLTTALLAIVFLDIDHYWVPDVITFPAMAYALAASLLPGGLSPLQALAGLVPAALLLTIAWVFLRLSGREGMGLGDVKLLAVLGLALGLVPAMTALILGALQGTLVGIAVVLTGGHRSAEGQSSNTENRHSRERGNPECPDVSAELDPRFRGDDKKSALGDGDQPWQPHPRAIPFGPFLILGALEVVLLPNVFGDLPDRLAELLIQWLR